MENHGIYEKLAAIQQELKAPKGQYNSFGKYKYRSCEDILEAVKPICAKHKTALVLLDDIREVSGRFYVVAQAQLHDCESDNAVTSTAFAREPDEKKGMDDSQITGTASSYARKYALNGLFCIDDTKDADTDDYKHQQDKKPSKAEMDAFNAQYKRDVEKNTCKDCGKPIYPVTHGGKSYTVAEIAENARKTYKAPLCWACMMARRKANESPTA